MLHGGDTYGLGDVIDFSANLNPLGTPPQVLEALEAQLGAFDTYPDPQCRDLVAAICAREEVPAGWVVASSGASDLFLRIALALKPARAAIPAPEFSGFEHALRQVGCETFTVGGYPLALEGKLDLEALTAGAPDIVFLSSPNNPTGLVFGREALLELLACAREHGFHVVLDESFSGFADMQSAVDLCADFPQLIVVKSLTKLYAIAGLRLGYALCSDTELVQTLRASGAEWAVSTPAQVAGVAALGDAEWEARTRAYVAEQRQVLAHGLEAHGLDVVPGQANYLLFRCERELHAPLLARGFAVRTCTSFEGLGAQWYRIAVRTDVENAAFLAALGEVLS